MVRERPSTSDSSISGDSWDSDSWISDSTDLSSIDFNEDEWYMAIQWDVFDDYDVVQQVPDYEEGRWWFNGGHDGCFCDYDYR